MVSSPRPSAGMMILGLMLDLDVWELEKQGGRDVGWGAPVPRGSLFACYPRKGLRSGMNWGGSGGVRMLRVRVLVWI